MSTIPLSIVSVGVSTVPPRIAITRSHPLSRSRPCPLALHASCFAAHRSAVPCGIRCTAAKPPRTTLRFADHELRLACGETRPCLATLPTPRVSPRMRRNSSVPRHTSHTTSFAPHAAKPPRTAPPTVSCRHVTSASFTKLRSESRPCLAQRARHAEYIGPAPPPHNSSRSDFPRTVFGILAFAVLFGSTSWLIPRSTARLASMYASS